ncbi:lysylphosphatidylglycerol synthase domain-containing protein [Granulosicoccaceae sp. 1_MG-2023]|nr:lysylphosphatidylglycerol synthase domain-containing protein [Granulosicoccaceae sp. 1_MG-2023]
MRAVIVLSVVVGIFFWLDSGQFAETLSSLRPDAAPDLIFALLIQSVAILISTYGWRLSQSKLGIPLATWGHSLVQMGLLSAGKYLPGKVFGMLARGVVVHRSGTRVNAVLCSTLMEQGALVHSGLFLVVLCLGCFKGVYLLFCCAFLLLTLAFFPGIAVTVIVVIMEKAGWQAGKLQKVHDALSALKNFLRFPVYFPVFLVFSGVWLVSALTLSYCISSFAGVAQISFLQVVYTMTFAYLAGFAVFIVPGGLGVREGAMVAILSAPLGLPVAMGVAALHRLLTVLVDIVFAGIAFSQVGEIKELLRKKS